MKNIQHYYGKPVFVRKEPSLASSFLRSVYDGAFLQAATDYSDIPDLIPQSIHLFGKLVQTPNRFLLALQIMDNENDENPKGTFKFPKRCIYGIATDGNGIGEIRLYGGKYVPDDGGGAVDAIKLQAYMEGLLT